MKNVSGLRQGVMGVGLVLLGGAGVLLGTQPAGREIPQPEVAEHAEAETEEYTGRSWYEAVLRRDAGTLQQLLAVPGVNLQARNARGITPIEQARRDGKLGVLNLLHTAEYGEAPPEM